MEQQLNSSTGFWANDDRRDEADFTSVSQTIAKPNVMRRLEDVMLQLGEVHNMLARTPLSKEHYNPISAKFAIAKVELFNIYNELKNEIT